MINQLLKATGFNIFDINPIYYAYIIFGLMTTGSLSEIIRSAILTVDKGQLEAAQAIGLSTSQAYIRIDFFRKLFRQALPNLCNLVINLVKGTSLVFVMTVKDITAIAKIEAAYGYIILNPICYFHYLYCDCGLIQYGFKFLEKRAQIV